MSGRTSAWDGRPCLLAPPMVPRRVPWCPLPLLGIPIHVEGGLSQGKSTEQRFVLGNRGQKGGPAGSWAAAEGKGSTVGGGAELLPGALPWPKNGSVLGRWSHGVNLLRISFTDSRARTAGSLGPRQAVSVSRVSAGF